MAFQPLSMTQKQTGRDLVATSVMMWLLQEIPYKIDLLTNNAQFQDQHFAPLLVVSE